MIKLKRKSGILLHITSIPGKYGIGEIGPNAFQFIDDLSDMGQKLWQILPTNPPDSYNCPYSAVSAFANNPILISFEYLVRDKLLSPKDLASSPLFRDHQVQFDEVHKWRSKLLAKASKTFFVNSDSDSLDDFNKYCKKNESWLTDFSMYTVINRIQKSSNWVDWETQYKNRTTSYLDEMKLSYKDELEEVKVLQYLFYNQWMDLKKYANSKDIQIIGDIPIYVAYNSADVWANQKLFKLNDQRKMLVQSGCPPDYFIETGQVWGHPIYDWDYHEASEYSWWTDRIEHLFDLVDIVRIDHFNGFAKYWEIPANDDNGLNGKWVKGPGEKLFNAIVKKVGPKPILAEDLGEASEDAAVIREIFNIPGMKILQMSFSNSSPLEKIDPNNVVYTGTHDNDTAVGWFYARPNNENKQAILEFDQERKNAEKVLNLNGYDVNWKMVEFTLNANANTSIIPMQDILGLDSSSRMNIPGTIGDNWSWRMAPGLLTLDIKQHLRQLTEQSNRI